MNVEESIALIFNETRDLVLKKNQDYGDSFLNKLALLPELDAETAIKVRISDKIARLKNLCYQKEISPLNESINDSIQDLIGYFALWLVVRGNKQDGNDLLHE